MSNQNNDGSGFFPAGGQGPAPQQNQMFVAVPQAMSPPQQPNENSGFTVGVLLASLRRCWFLAIVLGLMLGAGSAAAVWQLLPVTYTSSSEFVVQPNAHVVYDNRATGERAVDIMTFKETLRRQAKFPEVLTATLREDAVSGCETLRDVKDQEGWLAENVVVSSPATEFLQISLTGSNPEDVTTIVQAYTEAFKEEVIDYERRMKDQSLEKLRDVYTQKRRDLQDKRTTLRDLDEQMAANTEQANILFEKNSTRALQFEKMIAETEIKILETELRLRLHREEQARLLAEAEAAATAPPVETEPEPEPEPEPEVVQIKPEDIEVPEIEDEKFLALLAEDPTYQKMAAAAKRAENEATLWASKMKAGHPTILAKQAAYEAAEKEIEEYEISQLPVLKENYEKQYREEYIRQLELEIENKRRAQTQVQIVQAAAAAAQPSITPEETEESLEEHINRLELQKNLWAEQLVDTEAKSVEMTSMWVQREMYAQQVAALQEDERYLADRIEAREVESGSMRPAVEVRRRATLPKKADTDSRIKMAGMAGAGGFGLVVLLLVWREHVRRKVSSTNEVGGQLGLPLLAVVPIVPRSVSQKGKSDNRSAFWHNVLAESFDSARTMLLRDAELNSLRVVMIGSAVGGEGKTTLSCHLATSLARTGRRVLLIDGDLRRPSIHRIYGLKNEQGLCSVIRGETTMEEAALEAMPGLWVLPAGKYRQDTHKMLSQNAIGDIMSEAREMFDFVVVDSSPILPVADGLLISQHCDGVLFAVRRDVSQVHKVNSAVAKFRMLGVRIIGAVAIGLDTSEGYGQGYGYGSYGYHYNSLTAYNS